MAKLAYLLYRNPAVGYDDFVRHYHEVHSPLSVEAMPLQTAYAANLAEETDALRARAAGETPTPSAVDAVAFLRFDDLSVLTDPARLYRSRELEERLTADGVHLFSGMHGYVVDEVVQRDVERTWPRGRPSPGVKLIALVRRAAGIDAGEFRDRFEHAYGPTASARLPKVWRYVQNYVIDAVTPDAPPLDALAELHFRTDDDARAHRCGEGRTSGDDRLVDPVATLSVMARETIWID